MKRTDLVKAEMEHILSKAAIAKRHGEKVLPWPRLGDEGFEVEWCKFLPLDELGRAEMVREVLPTRKEALARAKAVYPKDQVGAVRITPVKFVDPYGDGLQSTFRWDPMGRYDDDVEFYEGE